MTKDVYSVWFPLCLEVVHHWFTFKTLTPPSPPFQLLVGICRKVTENDLMGRDSIVERLSGSGLRPNTTQDLTRDHRESRRRGRLTRHVGSRGRL